MSSSDFSENDPFQEDPDPGPDMLADTASTSSSYRRTSIRLLARSGAASRTAEAELLTSQLQQQGIVPAPGLPLSQLRELSDQVPLVAPQPMPAAPAGLSDRPGCGRGRGRGGKRTRKSSPPAAPPSKKTTPSQPRPIADQPVSTFNQPYMDNSLANTLQSLADSMQRIDTRLQSLERVSAEASTSATTRAVLSAMAPQDPCPASETSWRENLLNIHSSTPINITHLAAVLSTHPDPVFVDYLLSGLSQGFRVGVLSSPTVTFVAKNLQSALKEPAVVSQLIEKELSKGYIIGPFHSSPFSVFRTSPIGVATRKYSEKKRLIYDLSAPRSGPFSSVNSLIPSEPFSLHYASVDNAIKLIKFAGQGAWLSKADITDAFKIIPIHPSQWNMFGIRWESKLYFAVRLTFGCRSSPCIFNSFSEALCWILLNVVRIPSVLHLLDDFLLIDPPWDNSGASLLKLKHCFQELGVPLSTEKTIGPDTSLEFLGITQLHRDESVSPL